MAENNYCYYEDKNGRKIYYDKLNKKRIAKKNIDAKILDKIAKCDKDELSNNKQSNDVKYNNEDQLYYKISKSGVKLYYDAGTNKRVIKKTIDKDILNKIKEKE